ncbi:hypothetical protein Ndes2437B_g07966 [Nannochloris sp. 'desiccata']
MSDSSEASYLRAQGPKPKKTKYGIYVQDISKEEIESVFCYPAEEACVKLGICLTILKRLCRKFGIPRWPYRRLKCTIKAKDAPRKSQQPDQQQQRRTDRPQRQAALGVQDAVGRAKADINDDEIATVVVAPRNGKNAENASATAAKGIAPRVPEPSAEELAYPSMSAEESQALSVLLGGMGRGPAAAAVVAGAPGGGAGALIAAHTPVLTKTEAKDAVPAAVIPPAQPLQQQQLFAMNNTTFDSNVLKTMELAMQMHFVAEQQRQQHAAATAAMAAFAAAANAPPSSSSGQQQHLQQLQNAQNAQMFAAIMQTMSNMNAPQDPAAAMLARSIIDNFSASAASMPPWMAPFYNPQATAAAWNLNGASPAPAPAAPIVGNDNTC